LAKLFKPQPRREAAPTRLTIETQAHDGRGIARHQGKTVFVSGALPGETVEVSHYSAKSSYGECRTRRVLEAAPARIEPECLHFARCGGCSLQYQQPSAQLQFREHNLLQQLARQHALVPVEVAPALTSAPWGYRSRARLSINRQGLPAFRERDSDSFVPVTHCLVLDVRLQPLVTALAGLGALASHPITHIELLAADDGIAMVLRHTRALSADQRDFLQGLITQFDLQLWLQGERRGPLRALTGEAEDPRLYYSLPGTGLPESGVRLAYHPADFTQINADINRRMVAQALNWLELTPDDVVFDLFCGIGNFSLPMARQCRQVIGIEAIEAMVARGRENAAANGIENCEFIAADLETADLRQLWNSRGVNTVLLDPPRAGARQAVEAIGRWQPQKVLYVSCDPASLARDLALLAGYGYRLQRLGAMDMFPHTAHVESMALLVRR
jgi:23S rRNA (uracil1939-C5)-methyltransferase